MIGKSGERGSGISVLPARHDDDDDIKHYIVFRCLYIFKKSWCVPNPFARVECDIKSIVK